MMDILFDPRPMLESLNEAADFDDYRRSFDNASVYSKGDRKPTVDDSIEWAISTLKKHSRIIWFLRLLKINILYYSSYPEDSKLLERELRKFDRAGVGREGIVPNPPPYTTMVSYLSRFFNETMLRNAPEILNTEPGFKPFFQYIGELSLISENAENSEGTTGNYDEDRYVSKEDIDAEGWDLLFVCEDKKYIWYKTPNYYSEILDGNDGDAAMGKNFCGKCNSNKNHMCVLVSRQKYKHEDSFVPHVVFEVSPEGASGMSKGVDNQKISPRYFPQVVELLVEGEISSIVGGTYKPETDFDFNDLSEEEQQKVLKVNPDINKGSMSLTTEFNKRGVSRDFLNLLEDRVGTFRVIDYMEGKKDADLEWTYWYVTVQDIISDLMKNQYSRQRSKQDEIISDILNSVNFVRESSVEEYLNDTASLEEEIIGSEYVDHVTPNAISKFLDKLLIEDQGLQGKISDFLKRKGDNVTTANKNDMISHIVGQKSSASLSLYELMKRAMLVGYYFGGSNISYEALYLMAYLSQDVWAGFLTLSIDDPEKIYDLNSFLKSKTICIVRASALVDEYENYTGNYEDERDAYMGDEHIYEDVKESLIEFFRENTFIDFMEGNTDVVVGDIHEFIRTSFPKVYANIEPSLSAGNMDDQRSFETDDEYNDSMTPVFDYDSAKKYVIDKVRRGILERKSLSHSILDILGS